MHENRTDWRVRTFRVVAGLGGVLIGVVLLHASDWAHGRMKLALDVPDVVFPSDAPIIFGALAVACLVAALMGRLSGVPWYWTAIGSPATLWGFLMGYGVSHGLLNTSWGALSPLFGKPAATFVLVGAAGLGAGIGTFQGTPWQRGKILVPLAQVLLGMLLLGLFVGVSYAQTRADLECEHRLVMDFLAREQRALEHRVPKPPGYILWRPSRNR